ncbi:uncharacterized protein EI97DRAFT_417556 [Westerdykella ornata]|uniref:Uncharacterized protein n=1 Tax=Westerdykella ornata TaxID=318751 RepID=A0A6A6JK98_WESOR|nr:uncharacterized protein EI97DRAFT_417556 [Westerdykella ornata]KAF2276655.1 hypothetical protein EI97DRAFT_417556 [Westerdykella ornata]
MHLLSTLLALAATTSLTVAVRIPHIPDNFGIFVGHSYDNGTTVIESLSNSGLVPIVTHDPTVHPRSAKFGRAAEPALHEKRRTDCWGHPLDVSGVDTSINSLAQWAGNGHELRTSPNTVGFVGIYVEAVVTYYCISRPNSVGNLDSNDVWYAHNQMNSKCGQYMSGWFGWPGSVEIVGRAREGTQICQPGGPW